MFTTLVINGKELTLFEYRKRWYFVLSQFRDAMCVDFSAIYDSLQDYEKSRRATPRAKTYFLFVDRNAILTDMKHTNKVKIESNVIVNENVERFDSLCDSNVAFVAVEFVFFCDYLQTMHQRWSEKQDEMKPEDFRKHLTKRCAFWLQILDQIHSLEPIIQQYNCARTPAQRNYDTETDDLLNYLSLYRSNHSTNEKLVQTSTDIVVFRDEKCKKKRTLSQRDKNALAADQKWRCFYCNDLLDECFEIDHIERFCESGNDHHTNLWALCPNCHKKKGEYDRKRAKLNVWSDYRETSEKEKEKRRLEIINKIQQL